LLSGAACWNSAIHYLASQTFFLNLGGSLCDPRTLAICMPAN
jgi:hypothetical protein